VLDKFEQVIDAAPRISDLLTAAPRLKVLITSREVLRLSDETDLSHSAVVSPRPETVAANSCRSLVAPL
jgi:predicted ATPase